MPNKNQRKVKSKKKPTKIKFYNRGPFGSRASKIIMAGFMFGFGLIGLRYLYSGYAAGETDTVVIKNRTVRLGENIIFIRSLLNTDAAPLYQYPKTGNAEVFINTEKGKITSIIITGKNRETYLGSLSARNGDSFQAIKRKERSVTDKGKYINLIKRSSLYREQLKSVAYAVEDECKNDSKADITVAVLKDDKHIKQVADMIAIEPSLCGEVD